MKMLERLSGATLILFTCFGAPVILSAADTPTPAQGTPVPAAATFETGFVAEACQGGLKAVQLGRLASEKGSSEEVKRFAAKMVADHTKANEELKQLAATKGLQIATDLVGRHLEAAHRFSGEAAASFDKRYLTEAIADHQEAVKLLEEATRKSTDAAIKAFAEKTLPTLRHHLEEAMALEKKVQ